MIDNDHIDGKKGKEDVVKLIQHYYGGGDNNNNGDGDIPHNCGLIQLLKQQLSIIIMKIVKFALDLICMYSFI